MKKKIIILIALLCLAALFRLIQIGFMPIGGGRGEQSPNKKFLALADDFHNRKFWGGQHDFYEFTVESEGQPVQHIVMEKPPQDMVGWREDGSIQWAADSSSVTYSFAGTQLILSMKPLNMNP